MLTTHQVAEMLGYEVSHIRRLCITGKLPAVKYGRDWLISEADAATLAQQQRSKRGRPKKQQ